MMGVKAGRSIELFLVDGNSNGMMTATIPFQWSGHVLVFNRTQMNDALKRDETSRPGVYLLFGEDETGSKLYIGESDSISRRIREHDFKKDWWSIAVFITSSSEPLNKSHTLYLESQLIQKARAVNKYLLDNGKDMKIPYLSEASTVHMDDFLENIYLVLPALGFDFFTEDTKKVSSNENSSDANVPTFVIKSKNNVIAKARLQDNLFVVEEGSAARKEWVGDASRHTGYAKIYADLVNRGILKDSGNTKVFTSSYKFKSPSAAASVIKGRMANGAKQWELEGASKTYKEWEAEELLNKMMEY